MREPTVRLKIKSKGHGHYYVRFNYTDLAEHCNVNATTVSRYFNQNQDQRRVPSLEVMECIARFLKVSLDQLAIALKKGAEQL